MDIKALRNEFSQLISENQALLTAVSDAKRQFTGEEIAQRDAKYKRADAIKAELVEAERLAKYALDSGNAETPKPIKLPEAETNFSVDQIKRDLNLFAHTGMVSPSIQGATYGTDTTTQGGAYLPKVVLQPAEVRRLQNSFYALLDKYQIKPLTRLTPTAASLPVEDDRATVGQQQTESATSGTEADPTTSGSLVLMPTLYSSKQRWFSNTDILAQDFDVVAYALPQLAKRINKAKETAWTTKLAALTPAYTTESSLGLKYNDVLAWEHSLYAPYRSDAGFLVSDSLYKALRGVVDLMGRPILDEQPNTMFAATIHGKPVLINEYLAEFGTSAICGAFISASGFQIMDIANDRLARYIGVPTRPDQTGLEQFANGDCGFIPVGVSVLQVSANAIALGNCT
jgi:HK97 family phage major capsid protein